MCHQSVGLIARVVEAAGIPTLCMTSARDITAAVKPPRAVFVNFPLGHQTGRPNDPLSQRQILLDAFSAFDTLSQPGQIFELPYVWSATDRSWENNDYTPGFMPTRPSKASAAAWDEQRRQTKKHSR